MHPPHTSRCTGNIAQLYILVGQQVTALCSPNTLNSTFSRVMCGTHKYFTSPGKAFPAGTLIECTCNCKWQDNAPAITNPKSDAWVYWMEQVLHIMTLHNYLLVAGDLKTKCPSAGHNYLYLMDTGITIRVKYLIASYIIIAELYSYIIMQPAMVRSFCTIYLRNNYYYKIESYVYDILRNTGSLPDSHTSGQHTDTNATYELTYGNNWYYDRHSWNRKHQSNLIAQHQSLHAIDFRTFTLSYSSLMAYTTMQ